MLEPVELTIRQRELDGIFDEIPEDLLQTGASARMPVSNRSSLT